MVSGRRDFEQALFNLPSREVVEIHANSSKSKPPSMSFIHAQFHFFFFLPFLLGHKAIKDLKANLLGLLIWWSYLLGKKTWFHVFHISIAIWTWVWNIIVVWDWSHKWVGFFLINRVLYLYFFGLIYVCGYNFSCLFSLDTIF